MKIAVLISGRGSNLQSLIDAQARGSLSAEISLVISNIPNATGLECAIRAGIPTKTISHRDFLDRRDFEGAINIALLEAHIELVCLAGFMRLLTDSFVNEWSDRLVNIHPSLLPSFKGLNTHERALDAGVRFTGCTVHFVRSEMDNGPVILQAAVPILPDDDADSLAARVLEQEHIIYPLAVDMIASGRILVENGQVKIKDPGLPDAPLINPSG
ncbi:MAG: phosphoribosylglycinamide formyltransferase [Rhodospirillaceae bacterium]|nr:phosphoribosylglycinamide formyltransferase [Rhodospirillaceae bacterium]